MIAVGSIKIQPIYTGTQEIDETYVSTTLVYRKHIPVTTWEYVFSIDSTTYNAPATGGSTVVNITSYKKKLIDGIETGETETVNVSAEYSSGTDFTSLDRTQLPNKLTITYPENKTESSRTEIEVIEQQESGKKLYFTASQNAGVITYNYTFNLGYYSYDSQATANSIGIGVVSYKTKIINGTSTGENTTLSYSVNRSSGSDFVNLPGSSVSGDMTLNIPENTNTSSRTEVIRFTQSESSNYKDFTLSQAAGTITWDYVFSIDKTQYTAPSTGGSVTVNITSYKKKIINGKDSGQTQTVDVSVEYSSGDNFNSINREGLPNSVVISVGSNPTTSTRSERDYFIQSESNKTVYFVFNQEASQIEYVYECSVNPDNFDWFGDDYQEHQTAKITSKKLTYIGGILQSTERINYSTEIIEYAPIFLYTHEENSDGGTLDIWNAGYNEAGYTLSAEIGIHFDNPEKTSKWITLLQYSQ